MSAAEVQRKATEAYQQSLDEVLAALRRLALLRGCCKLGAVAARIEQDDYTAKGKQSVVTNTTE